MKKIKEKIRDEYRNTNISQNKLSDKYQVSISKVRKILNGVKKDKTGILRREFKERGYELLTSDYFHSKQKLKYYCTDKSHGVRTITYSDFNSGRGCGMCAGNQLNERGANIPIVAFTTNTRLLQPQHYWNIPSASANHLVLGMIERHGTFVGDERNLYEYL